MVSSNVSLIRRYFDLVSKFNDDPKKYEAIFHPDMVETEYPNLLSPEIRIHSSEEGLKGIALGKQILKFQKFDIQKVFESPGAATVEVIWSGEVAADVGPVKQDQAMRAYVCFIFEFKNGLILHQRHYDCFEPL